MQIALNITFQVLPDAGELNITLINSQRELFVLNVTRNGIHHFVIVAKSINIYLFTLFNYCRSYFLWFEIVQK